ncbi:MAG: putative toxin-antitoxin system toxin component, PIN family [bacterium]|nr:putative toxin-antitoxin system toxin component, PIN family [bacterium]
MFYAVIDTNVLVSALLNMNSNPGFVLCSVFNGQTTPLINTDILAEYREVLARKKFHFPKETVDIILKRLENSSLKTEEIPAEFPEVSDPKDRCFFAVTMAARQTEETLLITGNIRHFPQQPFVVTPAQFVEMLHNRA